jgi:anti-sigma factor RsiW
MSEAERKDGDEAFGLRAAAVFEASVDGLDAATRSRLNRARQRALESAARPALRWTRLLLPAGAMATVAVVGLAVFLAVPLAGHHGPDAAAVEDAEILTASEGIDLYAEDPEFFEWAGNGAPADAGTAPLDHG